MGILQSILGSPVPPNEPKTEPTINLPEDEYTVAYPVSGLRSQLTAFQSVIEVERNTPRLDGPGADIILDSLNKHWKNVTLDGKTWEESIEETRIRAEHLITTWKNTVSRDHDVIFLPASSTFHLEAFLVSCETRDDMDEDSFTLPDEFVDAVAFLKTLRNAEEEMNPVIVHRDQLPSDSLAS